MAHKKRRSVKPWSMHPSKHEAVAALLEADNLTFTFHEDDTEEGCIKSYDTSIMGKFRCHNASCGTNGWSSKVVAITIRMYPKKRYNVRVYHQRCQNCNVLSKPSLDESYEERVAYRLKRWSGVDVTRPPYKGTSKGPHKSKFCEGCAAGHCPWREQGLAGYEY
jgi:hypothetical protein